MKLKAWKRIGSYSFDVKSFGKTMVRESELLIPYKDAKRSVPAIRMIVTNQYSARGMSKSLVGNYDEEIYEVYLEDTEYGLKTSYGKNFTSLEQSMFVADVKLIELGHNIEEPFLIGDKDD